MTIVLGWRTFAFRTTSWHRLTFNKVLLETFLRDFGPTETTASHSCCTFMYESPIPAHPKGALCLHLSAKVLRLATMLKNAQLALRGPLRAKKKIPQTTSLNCWHKAGWMFLHQSVTLASECRSRKRGQFNLLFLFHCFLQCWFIFSVLSWQEQQSVWSSAAVVHRLQGFNLFWILCCDEWLFLVTVAFLSD